MAGFMLNWGSLTSDHTSQFGFSIAYLSLAVLRLSKI